MSTPTFSLYTETGYYGDINKKILAKEKDEDKEIDQEIDQPNEDEPVSSMKDKNGAPFRIRCIFWKDGVEKRRCLGLDEKNKIIKMGKVGGKWPNNQSCGELQWDQNMKKRLEITQWR